MKGRTREGEAVGMARRRLAICRVSIVEARQRARRRMTYERLARVKRSERNERPYNGAGGVVWDSKEDNGR